MIQLLAFVLAVQAAWAESTLSVSNEAVANNRFEALQALFLHTKAAASTGRDLANDPGVQLPERLVGISRSAGTAEGNVSILDPAKLAWLHIPKTGTSFANTLVSWACRGLDEEDVVDESYSDASGAFIPAFMDRHQSQCDSKFKLRGGHIPILKGTANGWDGHKGYFVSMFRQAEQRIVSGYFNDLHDVQNKSLSMREYAAHVSGCSVRMVLGHECGAQIDVTTAMVKEAAERLDTGFAFVGITEEWALSVCLWHKMFGGKCHRREFMNVRPGKKHSSTYDVADLESFTDPFDGALYAHATTIFWRNAQKHGVSPDSCRRSICADVPAAFD